MQRTHVRNQELALHIVIGMEPRAARYDDRALYTPARRCAEIEATTRQNCLSNRIPRVLYAPRAQVFGEHRSRQPASKPMLQPRVSRGIEIFLNHWMKQQI